MHQIQQIAVIGAGAVGTFYGAKLFQAGYQVQLQSSYASTMKNRPIDIRSIWGDFSVTIPVFPRSEEMDAADLIVISTKALSNVDYHSLVQPLLKPKSVILVLQNGINQEEILAAQFPKQIILGGLAFTCINRIEPIQIHHLDYGFIKMGPLSPDHLLWARFVAELFQKAGIKSEAGANLRALRWEKLLWNIPYNTLSVLGLRASTAEIMGSDLEEIARLLMHEVWTIAAADGHHLSRELIHTMLERTRRMEPYKTSMLLDFEAGRPMEVEAIVGEPVRIAEKHRLSVPTLYTIYKLLRFLNERRLVISS